MKRILFLGILFFSVTSGFAQENANYTTHIDSLSSKVLLEKIQYYLGSSVTLIKNDKPSEMQVTKKGVVKIIDKSIFFPKGLKGICSKIEGTGINKIIWVKFKKTGSKEYISLPFQAKDYASEDPFILKGKTGHTFPGENKDVYAFDGGEVILQISKETEAGLLEMQGVKVKN